METALPSSHPLLCEYRGDSVTAKFGELELVTCCLQHQGRFHPKASRKTLKYCSQLLRIPAELLPD